ncbi:hypothetical protein D3C76_1386630 [compost metagenome]
MQINKYSKVPTPLNSNTVAGLILNKIGTSTVAPNMANRCWKLSGIVWSSGGRSLTPITRRVMDVFPLGRYQLCKSNDICSMDFKLQLGGKGVEPQELIYNK